MSKIKKKIETTKVNPQMFYIQHLIIKDTMIMIKCLKYENAKIWKNEDSWNMDNLTKLL